MNTPKKSKTGNWVIPNSFQTPNFLVDELIAYLTPYELSVLIFAIRHILGYQENIKDRQAHISLSKFSKSGLGQQSIRNALESLDRYQILIKMGEPTEEGQLYQLQENEEKIDWTGLEERKSKKRKKASERTKEATKASLQSRGVTSDVRGGVGRNSGLTSDVKDGLRGTSTVKPTLKPTSKPNKTPAAGAAEPTKEEKPKSDYILAMETLELEFSKARGCPLPDWDGNPKASQKRWRTPLKKIYEACDKQVSQASRVVRIVTNRMRTDRLRFTSPDQILESALSEIIDMKSPNSQPAQPNNGWTDPNRPKLPGEREGETIEEAQERRFREMQDAPPA